jgi:OOP family OmpA-OmpF porin
MAKEGPAMVRRLAVVRSFASLLAAAFLVTACANGAPEPLVCAAIGGLLGAGGAGVAATHIDGSHDDEYVYPIGAAGGILLGTAGYFICKAMQEEEAAPPAPAPPPPRRSEEPAPMAEKIVLRGVNFDFDKSNIRPDAAVILDEAVRILGTGSGPAVEVEGHTDWIGTDAYNQGLSERRANSVKNYLADHGVDASRLATVGRGESQPIASNETRDGRALNRRVELHVLE